MISESRRFFSGEVKSDGLKNKGESFGCHLVILTMRCGEAENANVRKGKCISRESNPGHIDGNDVFYH